MLSTLVTNESCLMLLERNQSRLEFPMKAFGVLRPPAYFQVPLAEDEGISQWSRPLAETLAGVSAM